MMNELLQLVMLVWWSYKWPYDSSLIISRDEFGGTPKIFRVLCPLEGTFYYIFKKEFSEISHIWSFISGDFFEKFHDISEKFQEFLSTFTKLKKENYYFCSQISSQSKTKKTADFPLKTLILKIFSAFGPENLKFYVPKNTIFL